MAKEKTAQDSIKQKARKKADKSISAKLNQAGVTGEERHQLIMQAAYFRAERRGFTPGAELDDWLQAEAEVERTLREILAGN
jgi:hypothetical protein